MRITRTLLQIFAAGAVAAGIVTQVRDARAQAAPPPTTPPAPTYRARLLGVFNLQSGDPIEGAEVADVLARTTALTTKTGTVSLGFLPDGGSLVRIQKVGFAPQTIMVAISPADTLPFTILLSPVAQSLPTVVTRDSARKFVAPGLQGFEERRKAGSGHFITEDELRKSDGRPLINVLRALPNINFACPKAGPRAGECWAVTGHQVSKYAILGGSCEVDLYVDGAIYTDTDITKLRVDQFGGVEFYNGGATIPPLYNKTGSSCGVLLLWTRER